MSSRSRPCYDVDGHKNKYKIRDVRYKIRQITFAYYYYYIIIIITITTYGDTATAFISQAVPSVATIDVIDLDKYAL